jgi:DNA-binding NtrC family response regulator
MKILVVDDEVNARYGMAKAFRGEGREILEAENGREALTMIRDHLPDLVLLDLNMPEKSGLDVLRELQSGSLVSKPEIIVVTANDTLSHAIDCIRHGAADFIAKPYDVEHLRAIARRSEQRVQLQQTVSKLEGELSTASGLGSIKGISRPMLSLFERVQRAAMSKLPVLIRGESGTGKELVAKELHARSERANRPFIAINTAAIAESLIESELFGHCKGAFTGADREREGVFRKANGGTLFLDEIGDMPLAVQTRLLRVLQEGVVQPVGSEASISVDVRVVSATHQDLEQAIVDKAFRQDLFFRIRGIELIVPPLRARQEDILFLANRFLGPEKRLSESAVTSLLQYGWPGNVRELKQRIESASAMSGSNLITLQDIGVPSSHASTSNTEFASYLDMPLSEARHQLVEDFERTAIRRALELEQGNISAAARRLGIHRQSLQQKLKQLDET